MITPAKYIYLYEETQKMSGKITYNGHTMDEFVPRRSAAYVSQNDLHIGELTVRETVNFSAKCQGSGHRFGKNGKNK